MNILSPFRFVFNTIDSILPLAKWKASVGHRSYGLTNASVPFPYADNIQIGKFCSFASGVRLLNHGDHPTNQVSQYPLYKLLMLTEKNIDCISKGPINIGHDVWVGMNTIILGGVTIGNGAIIGAGSVVTHDVPPYAIAVGNPARVIKFRHQPNIIAGLQTIKWWDWSDEVIRERIRDFHLPVEVFVEKYYTKSLNIYSTKGLHVKQR